MEIRHFRITNQIKIYGNEIPSPCMNTDELVKKQLISQETFQKIQHILPAKPTALQSQIWPIALKKRNLVVVAQQEPGTSLSYILPAIISSEETIKDQNHPTVLILSAEDDSCIEVLATTEKLNNGLSSIQHVTDNKDVQKMNILLATHTKLSNLLLDGTVSLEACKLIIFDGIDRMLSIGGYQSIQNIFKTIKHNPQLLVYSSVWSLDVRVFVEAYVMPNYDYIKMLVDSAVPVKSHIERATHHIHVCKKLDKINKLCEILAPFLTSSSDDGGKKILVLVNPVKSNITEIASYLKDKAWPVLKSFKDTDFAANEKVWNEFKTLHELKILVTHSSFKHLSEKLTVKCVIVYDFPVNDDCAEAEFLYQISLAGYEEHNAGVSHLLYTDRDLPRAQELIDIKKELKQKIEPKLYQLAQTQNLNHKKSCKRLTSFHVLPEATEEGNNQSGASDCLHIKHYVDYGGRDKSQALVSFLKKLVLKKAFVQERIKAIIFTSATNSHYVAGTLSESFRNTSLDPIAITNTVSVKARQQLLQCFRDAPEKVLVLSDDIIKDQLLTVDDVNMVINYDLPAVESAKVDFLNRLRHIKVDTKNAVSITFFQSINKSYTQMFVNLLKELKQTINPLLELDVSTKSDLKETVLEAVSNKAHGRHYVELLPEKQKNKTLVDTFKKLCVDTQLCEKDGQLGSKCSVRQMKIVIFAESRILSSLAKELTKELEDRFYRCYVFRADHSSELSKLFKRMNEKMKNDATKKHHIWIVGERTFRNVEFDITQINLVVNYSYPKLPSTFVNRTANSNRNGYVISFIAMSYGALMKKLVESIEQLKQKINPLFKLVDSNNKEHSTMSVYREAFRKRYLIKEGNIFGFLEDWNKQPSSASSSAITHLQPTNPQPQTSIGIIGSLQEYFYQLDTEFPAYKKIPHYIKVLLEQNLFDVTQAVVKRLLQSQGKKSKIIIFASSQQLDLAVSVFQDKDLAKFPILKITTKEYDDALADSIRHGVLIIADDVPKKDIANVTSVINLNVPLKDPIAAYVCHMAYLKPDKIKNCSVISFLKETDASIAAEMREFMNTMDQFVTPETHKLLKKLKSNDRNQLTTSELYKTIERYCIDSTTITAFMDRSKVEKALPKNVNKQYVSARKDESFIEVLNSESKQSTLLKVLQDIKLYMPDAKIIIVADTLNDAEFKRLAHVITSEYMYKMNKPDIMVYNIIINYDFPVKDTYGHRLYKFTANEECFIITFFSQYDNFDEVPKLLDYLCRYKKDINPLLTDINQMCLAAKKAKISLSDPQGLKNFQQKIGDELKRKQSAVTVGNIKSFLNKLKKVSTVKISPINDWDKILNVNQFVEVLKEEQKLNVFLALVKAIFHRTTAADGLRVVVYVFREDTRKTLINSVLSCHARTIPILTLFNKTTESARSRTLKDFKRGILMVVQDESININEKELIRNTQVVINYDYPVSYESENMKLAEKVIKIYVTRMLTVVPEKLKKGSAITFFTVANIAHAKDLQKLLTYCKQPTNPLLDYLVKVDEHNSERGVSTIQKNQSILNVNDEIEAKQYNVTKGNIVDFVKFYNLTSNFKQYYIRPECKPQSNLPAIENKSQNLNINNSIHVNQYVELLLEEDKPQTLLDTILILANDEFRNFKMKIVVFANNSNTARLMDYLSEHLRIAKNCLMVTGVPANTDDFGCKQVINSFRNANSQILIISDEVLRNSSLDVAGINLLVNYDYPSNVSTYLNRIENVIKYGHTITFFTFDDTMNTDTLISVLQQMKQRVNPYLIDMRTATLKAKIDCLQKALSKRNTIKKGNIFDFFSTLRNQPSTSACSTTLSYPSTSAASTNCAKPKTRSLQFVEVLTPTEKQETLLLLIRNILSLSSYKNIKVIVFVREFTIEKIKQFDELLQDDMTKTKEKFPDLKRVYAFCHAYESMIERNLNIFSNLSNGVLITDVNVRKLGLNTSDFIIYYDAPSHEIGAADYYDCLNHFYARNSDKTYFITFFSPSDNYLAKDFIRILENSKQPVNPLIFKLIDHVDQALAEGIIKALRKTVTVGNISAFYHSFTMSEQRVSQTSHDRIPIMGATNQSLSISQLDGTLPSCITRWLENYGYNQNGLLQSNVWPAMFAKRDLMAIAQKTEERMITVVLVAVAWVLQANAVARESDGPLVVIFTLTNESLIKNLVRLLSNLLNADGVTQDLNARISVELPEQLHQDICKNNRNNFRQCRAVVFDEFDSMVRLGMVAEVAQLFESIRYGTLFNKDVSLSIFSAAYSAFEKLVCLEFLKNNHHFFNIVEFTATSADTNQVIEKLENIQQYVEIKCLETDRQQSLINVLKLIADTDCLINYVTIVFVAADNGTALQIMRQFLLSDQKIANKVFCQQTFANSFEQTSFWNHFNSQQNPIFITNDSRNLQKVQNVKYVINFNYPTGRLSQLEYLIRVSKISARSGKVLTYFGFRDSMHSAVLEELLKHTKQAINPRLKDLRVQMQAPNFNEDLFASQLMAAPPTYKGDLSAFCERLSLIHAENIHETQPRLMQSSNKRPFSLDPTSEHENKKAKLLEFQNFSGNGDVSESVATYLKQLTNAMNRK